MRRRCPSASIVDLQSVVQSVRDKLSADIIIKQTVSLSPEIVLLTDVLLFAFPVDRGNLFSNACLTVIVPDRNFTTWFWA